MIYADPNGPLLFGWIAVIVTIMLTLTVYALVWTAWKSRLVERRL